MSRQTGAPESPLVQPELVTPIQQAPPPPLPQPSTPEKTPSSSVADKLAKARAAMRETVAKNQTSNQSPVSSTQNSAPQLGTSETVSPPESTSTPSITEKLLKAKSAMKEAKPTAMTAVPPQFTQAEPEPLLTDLPQPPPSQPASQSSETESSPVNSSSPPPTLLVPARVARKIVTKKL